MTRNPIGRAANALTRHGSVQDVRNEPGLRHSPGQRLRWLSLAIAIACPALVAACGGGSLGEEATGSSEGMRGDWADATPLFEQAYAAYPDASNQFNLATAYQNSGQNAKATLLYEAVVLDGQYIPMNAGGNIRGTDREADAIPGMTNASLATVASRRLALMASRKAVLDQFNLLASSKALPVEKVLICDFPGRNGNGAGRLGEIIIYVDDGRRTASTLGFFVAAANQQAVDRFDSDQIVWTQRYEFVGHSDTYRYTLSRGTQSLDVTRPAPDTSGEAKVTASCHAAKSA